MIKIIYNVKDMIFTRKTLKNVLKNMIVFFICILMFSCSKPNSEFSDSQVFRYNEHSNITSLDPAFARDQRNIWPANLTEKPMSFC